MMKHPYFSLHHLHTPKSTLDQWHCFHCKDPLEEGERCKRCTCKWCGSGLSKGFCFICASSNGNSSIYDPNPNSFNDSQNFSYPPPQPQTYSYEQTANLRTSTPDFLQCFKLIYKGTVNYSNKIKMPQISPVLENIKSKDSYVSNLDEPALLVTPLSDVNEDECFDPGGDEIEACLTSDSIPPGIDGADFDPEGDILLLEKLLNDDPSSPLPPKELYYEDLKVIQSSIDTSPDFEDDYYDSEGDIIYLESLLNNDTIPYLPPEVFLDHDPNNLKDEPDLKSIVKVFDPGIHEKKFSPTYVSLPFEDRHYLSFTYVIRIFLPYFTYPVDSFLPLSSGSEDIIFDPDISAYSFYSLEPVAYKCPMEVCSSTCFVPNITMIWGESS
ncbi:hypothetical protein Tco_0685823 [Tanacetum coccineum]